jgi:CDP-4-dehydro-6-deoxyglucose reductase, E1
MKIGITRGTRDMGTSQLRSRRPIRIPYALAVHGEAELRAIVRLLRQRRTILGPMTRKFEQQIARLFGKKHGVMVNSGSSANLLAFEVLGLPEGSEVITPLLTFSTTVAPIVQKRLVPAFVDVRPGTYLVDLDQVQDVIGPKTKALLIPSLLGNVPDFAALQEMASNRGLWLIEDSCDTLGATFNGRPTGSYSHISTTSFYGSHVITAAGGGGMTCVDDDDLDRKLRIFRGWGRTSAVNESEDIAQRYATTLAGIPYDGKFIFEAIGYNFLPLELSAAFGSVQVKRLKTFSAIRRRNFDLLRRFFTEFEEFFILPEVLPGVRTNWLAFPLTIRDGAPFQRLEIVRHLEARGVQTRPVFTGNVLKHPGFRNISAKCRPGGYPVTDSVMRNSFLVGCHHGLTTAHVAYLQRVFREFLAKR